MNFVLLSDFPWVQMADQLDYADQSISVEAMGETYNLSTRIVMNMMMIQTHNQLNSND